MLGRLREGAKSPSGLAGSGQLPTAWGAFLRGLCPFSVVHTVQFFSIIFGWLYSIFYKHEQNMSPPY